MTKYFLAIVNSLLVQARLLEDALPHGRANILIRFSRDGHASLFDRVFVLAVAPARGDEHPPVGLDQLHKFAVFHGMPACQEILVHLFPSGKPDCAKRLKLGPGGLR
jgi:hypothetical protein